MSVDPGALARLRVRIEEVLGMDDTAALLDPLARVEWSRLATTDDLERLSARFEHQFAEVRSSSEHQLAEVRSSLQREISDSRALLEQRLAESQSQIRRDLLLVTGGQFFALIAAVAAVLGFG